MRALVKRLETEAMQRLQRTPRRSARAPSYKPPDCRRLFYATIHPPMRLFMHRRLAHPRPKEALRGQASAPPMQQVGLDPLDRIEKLLARVNARFRVGAPDMSLHRMLGQHAPFGDVASASSRRIFPHNLGFALRESEPTRSLIERSRILLERRLGNPL